MMDICLPFHYTLYAMLIFAFAAFTQGFTGLGFGIIAIAGIAFSPWDLERASVVINILLIFLNFTIIYAGRKDFKIGWKLVGVILLGEGVGVPIGYWFIYTFGQRPVFRLSLGMVLIIFSLYFLFSPSIKKSLHLSTGIAAGIVGGFFAGAFTAGGPPLALFLYSKYKSPGDAKSTLQVVFMAATMWRLFNIMWYEKGVTVEVLFTASLSIPIVILFAFIGHLVTNHIPNTLYLKIVYLLIGFAGILNIVNGLKYLIF